MPTFCVPLVRYAKRTSWRFAPVRSARADSTKRSSLSSHGDAPYFTLQAPGDRTLYSYCLCSRGGIGRRVRLRTVWGNPWRFESSREHFDYSTILISQQLFFSPPIELSLIAK